MSYNPFQTVLDESHLKPGTTLKKGDEELKVVKPVGDDKYLVKEEELDEGIAKDIKRVVTGKDLKSRIKQEISKSQEASMAGDTKTSRKHFKRFDKLDRLTKEEVELDEALTYKQTHAQWGVVPKSKKEFVKFFDKSKEAEARAHAEKTGGTLKKIDQMGRAIKEETELTEAKHRVSVTVSDPNHTAVSKRKEQTQKTVRVSAESESDAVTKAKAFYKKQGYKVHDAAHAGMVKEEVELDESMVAREKDGRKFVSAEAAIRLARELAAKRKPGEKATHADLQAAAKHLTREEVEQNKEILEDRNNPLKDIHPNAWHLIRGDIPVAINFPDENRAKSFHSGHGYGRETKVLHGSQVRLNAYLKPNPGAINYPEYSKGVAESSQLDELSKENQLSYASKAGDHAVRLAKAIKVRKEQGRGDSQEVKDMEGDRDKRVKGLARLAKRVSEAKEEKNPTDMTDAKCEKCKKDKYKERSQYDDMDGKVTCSCGHRVDRWKKYKN